MTEEHLEAYSDEEEAAFIADENVDPIIPQDDPEPSDEDEEEDGEDEDELPEPSDEDEEGDGEDEDEPQPESKKKKNDPKARIKQLLERDKEKDRRLQEAEFKLEQANANVQRLLDAIESGGAPKAAAEEEDDDSLIVDTALKKQLDALEAKTDARLSSTAIEAQMAQARASVPSFSDAEQIVLQHMATQARTEAMVVGRELSDAEARQWAAEALDEQKQKVYEMNKASGAVPKLIYAKALALGWQPEKSAGKSKKNKVNMKARDEMLRRAGQPTIRKESVAMGSGPDEGDPETELRKQNLADGMSQAYLDKMG